MSIQDSINRLGGIEPINNEFEPLSKEDILSIEQRIGSPLPDDYVWLLKTYGGFLFSNSIEFEPEKQQPEYIHSEETDVSNGANFTGSQVSEFYGKNNSNIIIIKKLNIFQDRMPNNFLPFADDGLGNQLCLSLDSEEGKVYWWNHELEWDAEDYEEETGVPMPVAAKYQNVYLVAGSLTKFFDKMIICSED